MYVGFTGTREALPDDEWLVRALVARFTGNIFVTGGCIGIDAMVAEIAHSSGENVHTIIPWNLTQVDPWVYTRCTSWERMGEGTSYRDRNKAIVAKSDLLVGIPLDAIPRSGTWQTVRLGQQVGIPVEVYTLELARKELTRVHEFARHAYTELQTQREFRLLSPSLGGGNGMALGRDGS